MNTLMHIHLDQVHRSLFAFDCMNRYLGFTLLKQMHHHVGLIGFASCFQQVFAEVYFCNKHSYYKHFPQVFYQQLKGREHCH